MGIVKAISGHTGARGVMRYLERDGVSVNIVFTISTNAFSPIPPMRFHQSRHRAFTAFGYLAAATSPSSSSARSFRR